MEGSRDLGAQDLQKGGSGGDVLWKGEEAFSAKL
jgi:hypothetical protein